MAKASESERRQFLRDLDRLVEDVSQPMGAAARTAPRTRDAERGGLIWRLRAEPEEPMFPAMFRLTWGVRVPGVIEQRWPPGSREAKRVLPDYEGALWAEDVQQLRTDKGRIYKYRLGPAGGPLSRLNPWSPDKALPLPAMTAYLRALVNEVLPPLMQQVGTRDDLAAWMESHQALCGYAHLDALLATRADILRRG